MPVLSEADTSAYDAFSPHYDAFTAHPNYPSWVRSLEVLARSHGLTGRRALDLGCGTGSSLMPLVELGYEATGCDASAGMLEQAARKLPPAVRLVAADMCALPDLGTFDLVWSLNDTLNYVADPGALRRALANAAACLRPEGVLLFDVNTRHTYATFFASTEVRESDALTMAWVGSGNASPAPGDVVEARIEVFELDPETDLWRRSTSRHRQRYHPLGEIRDALAATGLRVLGSHGLTAEAAIELNVDEERHVKAIFVAAPHHRERR
jgi:SAM-dependent methyltransferase